MYSVNGSTISLTRGDTFKCTVGISLNGIPHTPEVGDSIRFALKQDWNSNTVLLQKDIPLNTLRLELAPSDTKQMKFGRYVYDIQYTYANGDIDTFIRGSFMLTEEVD